MILTEPQRIVLHLVSELGSRAYANEMAFVLWERRTPVSAPTIRKRAEELRALGLLTWKQAAGRKGQPVRLYSLTEKGREAL